MLTAAEVLLPITLTLQSNEVEEQMSGLFIHLFNNYPKHTDKKGKSKLWFALVVGHIMLYHLDDSDQIPVLTFLRPHLGHAIFIQPFYVRRILQVIHKCISGYDRDDLVNVILPLHVDLLVALGTKNYQGHRHPEAYKLTQLLIENLIEVVVYLKPPFEDSQSVERRERACRFIFDKLATQECVGLLHVIYRALIIQEVTSKEYLLTLVAKPDLQRIGQLMVNVNKDQRAVGADENVRKTSSSSDS